MKAINTIILVVLVFNCISYAQNKKLYEFPEFQKAVFNETRTRSGEAGIKYWQNSSDYKFEVFIDTSKNILNGKGSIIYHNNSPVILKDIHIRLYQDLYKRGTARTLPVSYNDLHDGTYIDSLNINGIQYILNNKPIDPDNVIIFCTDLCVRLADSILSGDSGVIELAWNFIIPSSAVDRMGRYSDNYFIGLWYPQVAVYDDIKGWDNSPHLGLKEFYNDFNNFDITINVPYGYMVWATGECVNLESILNKRIIKNLNFAKSHDSIVSIIALENYFDNTIKGNSWHYKANHIPDFAFAAAKNYLWKGTSVLVDQQSKRRVFVDIAYPADSIQYLNSIMVAKDAVLWFSNEFPGIPFSYSHATSFFNGTRDGVSMEFPMIANDGIYSDYNIHNAIVTHELCHNYMPFYMGFNETLFGWMDEGWTEFLENKFKGDNYSIYEEKDIVKYPNIAGSLCDYPMITSSPELSFSSFELLYLIKPCISLMLLEELIGEENFSKATRDFINNWNGKHPTPYDFFNTFNKYAGDDINWFWEACYFNYGYADLGIKSVDKNNITIEKKGNVPVSIKLVIIYDDNSQENIYKNLNIWKAGETEYLIDLRDRKTIKKITLGDKLSPDIDITNNVYQK
jgi:hypothetical protein